MTIEKIIPETAASWDRKVFIEIDVDWAHEEIIDDTIRLLDEHKIGATFFATHRSAALSNIANSKQYEIGIHPNFIPLLKGSHSKGSDYKEVIGRLLDIFPDAKSAKSHSLVDSSMILHHYEELGITHDNTYLIDAPQMHPLAPWRLWNEVVRVPLYWEDDYACVTKYQMNFDQHLIDEPGLRVFGFHPLHIFLNTETLDRYEMIRSFQDDPKKLLTHRFEGEGTRNRFIKLLHWLSKHSGHRNI